ncbi:hypothetical protein AAJ76_3600011248 [Vairimorpha ceranae]|uniref:Uncharacterized protein n=1 Tax=Vairimorpha ceranae TaxID=40302 RepID=A0A0F9YR14_9MICR|nr:hypothetical protein AAJ76_3600011248 [Vairimorpha ceranae]KAF5139749.1 hypothetical protein G9O61_00g020860 [Vairimorpha ceranae]KAF5139834.1 hypothetical protein G9O61_00g020040 [Vairimorpha ceranae]KKO74992.1 hypothetical protein AAJ76_3600011248 [Vairimorpha ceranae]
MITLDDIIFSKDLENFFKKLVRNNDIIKQIRNFNPLKFELVEGYLQDPKVIHELEKYGRKSILERYYNNKK